MQEPMTNVKKAVGYIRVSTKSQEDSGIGLAWQADEIRSAARESGYVVDHIFEDTHTGRGTRSVVRRNGLQDAIDIASRDGIPIIVSGVDRLSRHSKTLDDLLLKGLLDVKVARDGKLLDYRHDSAAGLFEQQKGDLIAKRTKAALAVLKASGVKLGNPASISTAAAIAKSRKTRSLRSADVVRDISDFLAKNPHFASKKLPALVSALNDAKIRTGWGREWTGAALRKPLSDARKELEVRAELEFDDVPFKEVSVALSDQPINVETQSAVAQADHYESVKDFGRF